MCDIVDNLFLSSKSSFINLLGIREQVDGHNQSIKTKDLGEDKDQNHSYEQSRLLGRTSNSGITHNADGVTGCETREADCESGSEVDKSTEKKIYRFSYF